MSFVDSELAQKQLDVYKYPVLTLPNEITSEIFIHFLPVYPRCPPPTGILSQTHLTHICRTWRAIALATPSLWKAMALNFVVAGHHKEKLERLKSWLARSGSCPLSIQMNEEAYHIPTQQILDALVPHRARLEYATLNISAFHLPAIQGPMPLLRQLRLLLDESIGDGDSCVAAFDDAPLLRSVTLEFSVVEALLVRLPWYQLTRLTLQSVYPRECTPVLQQTINLVQCELELFFDGLSNEPTIFHRHLQRLVLVSSGTRWVPLMHYLGTFVAPALLTLQIPHPCIQPHPILTLTSFVASSGCNLQTLCIIGDKTVPRDEYRDAFSAIRRVLFKNPPLYERVDLDSDLMADHENSNSDSE